MATRNAIRELVLNAIAHKNYALMVPMQIKVFSDHIVISNDCVFPKGWTVENLLAPHRSKSAFTRLKKSGKIEWDGKNNQNGR